MGDWDNIESILDKALALPEGKRKDYINEKCCGDNKLKSEVTQLLDSITASEGWLENPQVYKKGLYQGVSSDIENIDISDSLIDQDIGNYTIKEKLGQGGMGTVYRAERSDGTFEHQVAIKVIRSERATDANIRRFERERNILAGLNHPGIARLFDGGITDQGIPYLTMEYIDGIAIDQYCRTNKLSIDERINLFQKVLDAVMYAHKSLVVHRDLKPENILVTADEQIKILDFGISSLLETHSNTDSSHSITGGRPFTLRYAAPEQVKEQPITTATDLYALGAVFYELLCGNHPLKMKEKSFYESEQLILSQCPPAPSSNMSAGQQQFKNTIRGDLNAIALKALRKEPEQRYRTANHFLHDLTAYQQGLPVSARPYSLKYRSRKFLTRHKYVIGVAACFLALIIALSTIYTLRITEERNNARLEAQNAIQIKNLLNGILQQTDPFIQTNRNLSLVDILDNGSMEIRNSLVNKPQIKAELLGIIGDNYVRLGNFDKGEELLNEAIDLHEPSNLISIERTYINNLNRIGLVYLRTGRYKKAKTAYLEALATSRNVFGPESQIAIDIYVNLGLVYRDMGQYLKSREYYNTALILADSSQKRTIALSIGNLAEGYRDQGLFQEAIDLHKKSLKLKQQLLDSPHPVIASAYNSLAFTYQQSGQYQKADSLHQIALSMRRTLFPPDHHHIASSLIRLGLLKIKQLLPQEAEQFLTEGYDILSRKLPENHWQIIGARGGLAVSRAMQGEFETNLPIVEETYQNYMENFGTDDWRTREAAGALASLYHIWGKTEKANYYSRRQ